MKKNKVFWRILFQLHGEKKRIVILLVCFCAFALFTFIQPLVVRNITDLGMINKSFENIIIWTFILFIIMFLGQIIGMIQASTFVTISNTVNYRLYEKAFSKLVKLPICYFQKKNSAEITGMLNKDINIICTMINQYMSFSVSSILQIVAGMLGLVHINLEMTICVLLFIPLKLLMVKIFSKRKNKIVKNILENDATFYGWMASQINGIEEIKLWDVYEKICPNLKKRRLVIMQLIKEEVLTDQYRVFYDVMVDTILTVLLYILGGYFYIKGNFSMGSVFAFITYSTYVITPVSSITALFYYFAQVKPSAQRLFDFYDLKEEELVNITEQKTEKNMEIAVEFSNVSFAYNDEKIILDNASFDIKKGEKILLVGENGEGKSTIFKLIAGFYIPKEGKINVEGEDISKIGIKETRKKIAMVRQNPYIFEGSIKENIVFFQNVLEKDIENAVKSSNADKFILKLPNKYEEIIEEEASKLSGGEKAKLSVARALLKQSNILLLDEATASFDKKSREKFYRSLNEEYADRTAIIIAHHGISYKYIDRILEVKKGKIIEVYKEIIET